MKNLFNDIEKKYNLNYVAIFKIGDFNHSDLIINSLISPKILIDSSYPINYLNFPRYSILDKKLYTLKYFFNREFMNIYLIKDIDENLFFVQYIEAMSTLSYDQIMILVSENLDISFCELILQYLHNIHYLNVICFDLKDFEETGEFYTFERFPNFKTIQSTKFQKEYVSNVQKQAFKILCKPLTILAICPKDGEGYGQIFQLVNNFVEFINGSKEIYMYKEQYEFFDISTYIDDIDFSQNVILVKWCLILYEL